MKIYKAFMIVTVAVVLVILLTVLVARWLMPASVSDRCYVPGIHAGAPAGCPQ